MMVCRAGRECKVGADGEAACACLATCPDHFVPVCGSNNQSYDNFCLMHRDACLTGVHISLKKKGYCSNKSIKKKSSKKDKVKDENHFEPGKISTRFHFESCTTFKCRGSCGIQWCASNGKEMLCVAKSSTTSGIIPPIRVGTDRT